MTMYGNRVTKGDYKSLIGLTSVGEATDYLKRNTHYGGILEKVDANSVYRGLLESFLRKDEFETYLKIISFEHLGRQEFFNYLFLRSEIDEILNCIRYINAKSDEHIQKMKIFYNPYSHIDFIELARVRTFQGLLKLLDKTPYHGVLSAVKEDDSGNVDFSRCEVSLRTYYYKRLLQSVDFPGEASDRLKFLIKSDIDLINVTNAYRLTAFFNEEKDVIKRDMLPFYGRLSSEKLSEIYEAGDADEFIARFSKTYYGLQMSERGLDLENIESSARKLRYRYAKLALKRSMSAPLSVYAFMYLRHIEVMNIITIAEAVKYKLPAEQIERLIIVD
jgi:V/A-type H+-transporting ATPase subunit C